MAARPSVTTGVARPAPYRVIAMTKLCRTIAALERRVRALEARK